MRLYLADRSMEEEEVILVSKHSTTRDDTIHKLRDEASTEGEWCYDPQHRDT